ncbi:MAG: amylo-alpha-1,6-glucosidase [Candidatus Paceibacterota bacterium]
MELIHNLGRKTIKKTVDPANGVSLMLGGAGSYLWTGPIAVSRYQGWFFGLEGSRMLKIIDDIQVENGGDIVALENNFWNIKKIRPDMFETFYIFGSDCLAYESSKFASVRFFLDIKESYKNPEIGHSYQVRCEDNLILIKYHLEGAVQLPDVFLAVAGDFDGAKIKQEWIRRDYEFDRRRGSAPWQRWVFVPAELNASKLVFAAGGSEDDVAKAARSYWRDFEKIKWGLCQEQAKQSPAEENGTAKCSAQNALRFLVVKKEAFTGLRAGLPWFFQFWQRDEAVSLAGLDRFDPKLARDIFWEQIKELTDNNFHFDTADGIGWLFLRAAGLYANGKFNFKEIAAINDSLQNSIDWLLKNSTQNNLAVINAEKTWMDSLDRSGAGIEIQALRLNMYALAADFAADKKQKAHYLELEKNLKNDTRMLFFDGKNLADRFDVGNNKLDLAARPNIFLAAYIYPDLLSKNEWTAVFENALGKLWLDWGGLSTIDKSDPRYCGCDRGENPAAYHNGDSWFWVNNIAAIVLSRVDKNRFKDYIEKIFEASKNDILWNGAIGCASEISSAQSYESSGCPNQAWSNATFLELCAELKI